MKYLLIVFLVVLLSGCKTVPVTKNFPEVSPSLLKKCPELKTIDPNVVEISKLLDIVTENYSEYHVCRKKVDEWINWYNSQKENYNNIK